MVVVMVIVMALTHCSLVLPYGDIVNIGSGNGLVPDGNKLLPEPMLTYHQTCFVAVTSEQFHKKFSWNLICNMCSEILHLKLQPRSEWVEVSHYDQL